MEFAKHSCFNRPFKKNVLPESLKKITFGDGYNTELKPNRLPPNLKYLTFGEGYLTPFVENTLPNSLKYLEFGFGYAGGLRVVPESVEIVCINMHNPSISELPQSVKKIIVKNYNGPATLAMTFPLTVSTIQLIKYKILDKSAFTLHANCKLINEYGDQINL